MSHKKQVLKRHPKAICYMSQFSGMYFVKSKPGGYQNILAWEPSANAAWKQANVNPRKNALHRPVASTGGEEKP